MHRANIFLLILVTTACVGCGVNITNDGTFTATPDFVTVTLPPSLTPPLTQISILPASTLSVVGKATISPIEGTTTTQVNVRAETSTASEALGMIGQFVKVQIIGRDASGSWYRIVYPDSVTGFGWIRAEYVQVSSPAEIPLVESVAGNGSGVSGLVIQKINVRKGPGKDYESLGVLNPNDVVFITGKDFSGSWMQIEFATAPDGKGWVAAEFLEVNNPESLPVIGDVGQAVSPTNIASTPTTAILTALDDGDSMQTPAVVVDLSALGARILQFNGDVSSPEGDMEDWMQFTSSGKYILAEMECSNHALRVELWTDGQQAGDILLACGEIRAIKLVLDQSYFFRIQADSGRDLQYIRYTLRVSAID